MDDFTEVKEQRGQLFPVWRVRLAANQTQSFILRLDGYNLMRFPMFAMQDDAFQHQQRHLFLGLGFVLAVPLVVLLYVLTLIRIAEDKSLPIFIVMALAEIVGAAWVSGFLHASLPWLDRWASGWLGWSSYVLLLGLSGLHARVFMQTQHNDPLADRTLVMLTLAWCALPLYAYWQPEAARLCLLVGGTLHAFALVWLCLRAIARHRQKHLGLFTAVWVVYASSGLLYVTYRLMGLPIYVTLMSNFIQGSVVATLLGCAVSVQIIQQKRNMQQSVRRSQERSDLYAAAHHDLWQPIQSVSLYASALKTASAAQQAHYLRGIQSAVTSVHDFMEGLRGAVCPPNIQTVSLPMLLQPLIDEYRLVANTKQISLRYYQARAIANSTVQTDPALLARIVRNLLSNAIRYTAQGGRVLLGYRRYKGQLWLMVYDNGQGMTPAQTAHCFEAYAREGDTSRVPEGLGLGLYSVKQIAHSLQTSVRIDSRLGKGTAIGIGLNSQQN